MKLNALGSYSLFFPTSVIFRYCLLLLCLITSTHSARSVPQLSADETSFDIENQRLYAKGNVLVVDEDLVILSNEAAYDRKANEAQLKDNVQLTKETLRLLSDELFYRSTDRYLRAKEFRVGQAPFFLEGSEVEGTTEEIDFKNVRLHLQEPDPFGISLQARSGNLKPDEKLELKGITLRLGKLPIFYLPYFSQKSKKAENPLDISVEAGQSSNLGFYLKSETRFPITQGLQLGPMVDIYSKRGVLFGPSAGYKWASDDGTRSIESDLIAGFISDNDDPGNDILGNKIDSSRDFLIFRHRQDLMENLSLVATYNQWSDSEVLRDFRENLYDSDQIPDSFVETVYTGENFFLSAFARLEPNDFQLIQERTPEIRLDLVPTEIAFLPGYYYSLSTSFAKLREKPLDGGSTLENDRLDLYYSITRPIKIKEWLNLTPLVGAKWTHYSKTLNNGGSLNRLIGEIGFDAEMTAVAQWDYQNKIWGINKLRHLVQPTLSYRYLPGASKDKAKIIPIDEDILSTSLESIDLSNIRSIDELEDAHILRFGLENTLQTLQQDYGSRNLASLNFYQDLRFNPKDDEREWGNLYSDLTIHPIHWFKFSWENRFDPETLTLEQMETDLTLIDGDVWELNLSTIALQNEINQHDITYYYQFNQMWAAEVDWHFDTRSDHLVQQTYSLMQKVGNSWIIEYEIKIDKGDSREGDNSFNIRFDYVGF